MHQAEYDAIVAELNSHEIPIFDDPSSVIELLPEVGGPIDFFTMSGQDEPMNQKELDHIANIVKYCDADFLFEQKVLSLPKKRRTQLEKPNVKALMILREVLTYIPNESFSICKAQHNIAAYQYAILTGNSMPNIASCDYNLAHEKAMESLGLSPVQYAWLNFNWYTRISAQKIGKDAAIAAIDQLIELGGNLNIEKEISGQ